MAEEKETKKKTSAKKSTAKKATAKSDKPAKAGKAPKSAKKSSSNINILMNKVNKYECEIRKYAESCDDCNFCKMED